MNRLCTGLSRRNLLAIIPTGDWGLGDLEVRSSWENLLGRSKVPIGLKAECALYVSSSGLWGKLILPCKEGGTMSSEQFSKFIECTDRVVKRY